MAKPQIKRVMVQMQQDTCERDIKEVQFGQWQVEWIIGLIDWLIDKETEGWIHAFLIHSSESSIIISEMNV